MPSRRLAELGPPGLEQGAPRWVPVRPRPRPSSKSGLILAAWWNAWDLDRKLAAGVSPSASATLALRARKITARRNRSRIADGLIRAVRSAHDTAPAFSSAVRPHAREVIAARTVLVALDRRLRTSEPVSARGMAMLSALLTEPASPLYQPTDPGVLGSRLRAAAAALEPGGRCE